MRSISKYLHPYVNMNICMYIFKDKYLNTLGIFEYGHCLKAFSDELIYIHIFIYMIFISEYVHIHILRHICTHLLGIFEYGHCLKAFPDEPILVLVKEEVKEQQGFFKTWYVLDMYRYVVRLCIEIYRYIVCLCIFICAYVCQRGG
jgi:hypothetical protein